MITFWHIERIMDGYPDQKKVRGYKLAEDGTLDTKTLTYTNRHRYSYNDRSPVLSKKEVLDKLVGFVEVDVVLSTGKKLRLKNIKSIAKD